MPSRLRPVPHAQPPALSLACMSKVADTLNMYDWHRAADELWVTFPVLVDRLKHLTEREVEQVTARRERAA